MRIHELFVDVERDEDGYPPADHEHLAAQKVGPSRYRLLEAPAFVQALAVGDIVATNKVGGRHWITHVVEESDRWLVQLIAFRKKIDDAEVVKIFQKLGCNTMLTNFGIITIDGGPEVPIDPVLDELRRGFEAGLWDYQTSVLPEDKR